ncbi:MAG: type II secretion system F family protein [Chloroflexi bacterium]|nr:type II secretion system F family protein [Chloroflexota bacterium]
MFVVPFLTAGLVVIGVLLVFYALRETLLTDSDVEERLDLVMGRRRGNAPEATEEKGTGGKESALAAHIEKALAKRTFAQGVQDDLRRADLKLTVTEYMGLRIIAASIGAVIGYIAGITNELLDMPPAFLAAGAFIGWMAPSFYVGRRQSARLSAFVTQRPDTITLLANGLRAGNSLPQAMEMASREAPAPTGSEFARVVTEISLGLSPEEALNNLVRRVPSPDLDLMVTAMNVQREVGGNLAQVLEAIGNTIRERVRIKGDIETKTAQVQGSAYIISALPGLIGLVIFLLNGDYMRPMLKWPWIIGYICAGIMIFVGFIVMRKMTEIKV